MAQLIAMETVLLIVEKEMSTGGVPDAIMVHRLADGTRERLRMSVAGHPVVASWEMFVYNVVISWVYESVSDEQDPAE